MSNKRLQQALIDNGETPETAEELSEIGQLLDTMPAPRIREGHQQQLLAAMLTELPQPKSCYQQFVEWYPIAVMLSQVRIIDKSLWAASSVVILLGVMITMLSSGDDVSLLTIVAPIVAAGSMAVLYDDTVRAMLEIEDTTRASAQLILFARMTLVFSFNLALATLGSVILAAVNQEMLLIPLIMSWLAPMTFLAGLAFFLSIVARDTLFAALTSLVLWISHQIMSTQYLPTVWLQALSMPGFSDPANRPLLLTAGAVLMMAALWIVSITDTKTGYVS